MSESPRDLEARARDWLAQRLPSALQVRRLPGDVSTRRYLRVETPSGERKILAWYPEDQRGSLERFCVTTRLLADAGIPVPEILDVALDDGWMLVQDVGERTLFDLRDRGWPFLAPRVCEAARLAARLATVELPEAGGLLGPLDGAALAAELEMTWDEFLIPSGLDRAVGLGRELDSALTQILSRLEDAPRVPCHRDFMARNLVPAEAETTLFVLDHQDLRPGPAGYDLASLLNDSLFPDRGLVTELLEATTAVTRAGYDPCVVQRTLKIVGTFRRFARSGSPRYLELIPPSLTRCVDALARLESMGGPELARDLRRHWGLGQTRAGRGSGL